MKRILIITLLLIFGIWVLKQLSYTHIEAKFSELRPIHEKLKVYYKGLVIGHAKELKHSHDFNHTIIKIALYPRNLLLPSNTTVLLKKEKKKHKENDFLELIYPKNPTNKMLSNGSIIEGIATVDVDEYMSNRHPDELEEIKENLAQSAQNLNYALEILGQVFLSADNILNDNRKNIQKTTSNIEQTTRKINNSIEQEKIKNTFSNIETTTKNINLTYPNINETLNETKGISSNLNAITCGIRKTLRKNFGGLRLFFGKVIDECE